MLPSHFITSLLVLAAPAVAQTLTLSPDPLQLDTGTGASLTATFSPAAPPGGLLLVVGTSPGVFATVPAVVFAPEGAGSCLIPVAAGPLPGGELVTVVVVGYPAASVTVSVVEPDLVPPVITCPTAVSVLAPKSGPRGAIVHYSASANDAVDPSPSLTCVPASGSFFPWGATTVTCTANDAAGNQSVRTFSVTVRPSIRVR